MNLRLLDAILRSPPTALAVALALAGCRRQEPPAGPAPPPDKPVAGTAAEPTGAAGAIAGRIVLKGAPPPEVELPLDPSCGKLHTRRPTTRHHVVGNGGGLADVFVHITKGLQSGPFEPPASPVMIDQKACEYVPYVLGAQTRQIIRVKNSDPLLHNVHPTPTVSGNREYNRAQLPNSAELEFNWSNPEVFLRFKCDVHPWMYAYVGLVDHPFHAVTGADGTFSIKAVPAGSYSVEAYHRKAGGQTRALTVKPGDTVSVEFTFEAASRP